MPTPRRIIADFTRQAKIMDSFQKIFQHDYLPSLREHHQATSGRYKQIIQVGDVVLIDNDGPRISWPMAVVEKLIVSKDGCVRAADIRTVNGKTNRPINKLVPLEVTEPFIEPTAPVIPKPVSETTEPPQSIAASRTTRKAAAAARGNIPRVVAALHRNNDEE